MNEFLTPQDILFGLAVLGAIGGLWWRVEAKIDKGKSRADEVSEKLDAYKLHVAETYVNRDGQRELFAQVLASMSELKTSISHVATRVDSLFDQQIRPQPRRRSGSSE